MKIGFIGVGNMGGPMCQNIITKSEHEVIVYDLNAKLVEKSVALGARPAESVASLVRICDVVITSLPTPRHVEQVALGSDGIIEHARKGTVFIDLSTNSPTVIRRIAEGMEAKDIKVLEAPVSGGVAGAAAATIVIMVGGEQSLYEQHLPLFRCFSSKTVHTGAIGTASVAKLINNMISLCTLTVCAEGLMIAASTGISLEVLNSVISAGSGNGFAYQAMVKKLASRDFSANFSLDLAYKDVSLALDLAAEHGVPTLMASQTVSLMRMARGMGLGSSDCTAVINVLEKQLGYNADWN